MKRTIITAFIAILFGLLIVACDDGGDDNDDGNTLEILRPRVDALVYLDMDLQVMTEPSADSISVKLDDAHLITYYWVDSIRTVDISSVEPGEHTIEFTAHWTDQHKTAERVVEVFDADMPAPDQVIVGGVVIDEMYVLRNAADHVTGIFLDPSTGLTEPDLTGIDEYPLLNTLALSSYTATEMDFTPLYSCYFMETLTLQISGLESFDWEALNNMTDLRILEVHGGAFEHADLRNAMDYVQVMDLSGNAIRTVEFPRNVSGLTQLDLSDNQLESIGLASFTSTYTLAKIDLSSNNLTSITVPHIPFLKNLNLSENQLESMDIANLTSSNSLETFNVASNNLEDLNLSALRYHTDLIEVHAGGNPASSIDLAFTADLPLLEVLDLTGGSLELVNLSHLAGNMSLKELLLGSNNLTSIDLSPINDCDNIEVIDVSMNALSTLDLGPLWNLNMLNQLYLQNNDLEAAELNYLSSCSSLRVLNLSSNMITELYPVHLGEIPALVLVNFTDNPLSDETCGRIDIFMDEHPTVTVRSDCD